jgi:outer membrane protein, multidrug efflux system
MNMQTIRISLVATVIAALTGCAGGPAQRPDLPVATAYDEVARGTQAAAAADAAPVSAQWWRSFNSPRLDAWIETQLAEGPDLRIATERVRQAQMALKGAKSALFPDVALSASSSRSRSEPDGGPEVDRESTSAGLSVGYEVDLWGRVAADVRGARANFRATQYDYDALRISTASAVAATYFQMLATAERSAIARENLEIAERVLGVVESRFRNGVATSLEVSQQTVSVLAQRTALLPLETQERQLQSALALLLGEMPQGFDAGGENFAQLAIPQVAPGLPSELLSRRPDLAAAEADLDAAAADLHIARTSLFPSISLSGSGGVSSAELLSLTNPATSLSAALSMGLTLFDAGRRSAQIETARSQQRIAVETYASAVRGALKEVDDGLGNADISARQESTQQETVEQAQRSLRLAELRYREGADDLLSVLDSQRVLFQAQDSLVQLRLSRLNASLDLYKALGGGWTPQP